jgi:hypothetical protein
MHNFKFWSRIQLAPLQLGRLDRTSPAQIHSFFSSTSVYGKGFIIPFAQTHTPLRLL